MKKSGTFHIFLKDLPSSFVLFKDERIFYPVNATCSISQRQSNVLLSISFFSLQSVGNMNSRIVKSLSGKCWHLISTNHLKAPDATRSF